MTKTETSTDKMMCINCGQMRPKTDFRKLPLKGKNGFVKRCTKCLDRSRAIAKARLESCS